MSNRAKDFVVIERLEEDQEQEEEYEDIRQNLLEFSYENPFLTIIFLKLFVNYITEILIGTINIIYCIGLLSVIFFFENLLSFENWFSYSLCLLSFVIAVILIITYIIEIKSYGEAFGWTRGRSILYFIISICIFLFPNSNTDYIISLIGFFSIVFGLYYTFKKRKSISTRIAGVFSILVGILLIVLPRFSLYYYHIFVISLIGVIGIIEIILALIFRRIQNLYHEDFEGFTDYMIE